MNKKLDRFFEILNDPLRYPSEHDLAQAAIAAKRPLADLYKNFENTMKLRELNKARAEFNRTFNV